jgi:hypothetical protein
VRLIVCWSTTVRGVHACADAYHALKDAGHDPKVQKAYGSQRLPAVLNPSAGRREARERTGTQAVPLLVLDDESHVAGSRAIVEWALSHPATAPR